MGIVSFLFGFHGRINRTSFFLASTVQGLLILAGALILQSQHALPDFASVTAVGNSETNAFGFEQQASSIFIVWSVVQLPLIFKRVRDMHEVLTFAWIYSFFVLIGTTPGMHFVGHGVAALLITWFSLQGSRAIVDDNSATLSKDEIKWNQDTELDAMDIVARARELKAAETDLLAKHAKAASPKAEVKSAFGKRAGMTAGNK